MRISTAPTRSSTAKVSIENIDSGPPIIDSENVNSRLWALSKRATERGDELHTTHPVLAQVWRNRQQANPARATRHITFHALDDIRDSKIARGIATIPRAQVVVLKTSDVVDAHLAVVAEHIGTFILTTDPTKLNARFETY